MNVNHDEIKAAVDREAKKQGLEHSGFTVGIDAETVKIQFDGCAIHTGAYLSDLAAFESLVAAASLAAAAVRMAKHAVWSAPAVKTSGHVELDNIGNDKSNW